MLSKTHHILLVEDHRDSADVLARLLRSYGHVVQTADCGRMARETYRAGAFDVLLLDIGLPDCDGIQLLHDLRQVRQTPAIAITGYALPMEVRRCKEAGFVAHITKPFDLIELRNALNSIRIG